MPSLTYEQTYAPRIVCGVDEAGRGPWAGPVVAAAVIFHPGERTFPAKLSDSKKLSRTAREGLISWIEDNASIGIGEASVEEIDTLNILRATLTAMQRAVAALPQAPDIALIDGNRAPELPCAHHLIVGGDDLSYSIAAASIIAKVTRDRMMHAWHETYPQYGFDRHSGYGTKAHQQALGAHGPSPIHRRSFAPIRALLQAA